MFECKACVLRCIRAIAGDAIGRQPFLQRPLLLTPRLSHSPFRRAASTALATARHDFKSPNSLVAGAQPVEEADEGGKVESGIAIRDEKALKMELRYLQDPVKLAEHVRYTLRCNKPEKALDLCRLASRKQEVVVSWNACVDWYMSRNESQHAIKIYNEMKKRAQFPDSYTYLLLLRGLAKPHHHGQVVRESNLVKAMSIYNSMSSPTSRVKPNIIHTNAALRVCSAALDMDALWSIASRLPSSGDGSPDHVTYAILLNGIRHGAFGNSPEDVSVDQVAIRRNSAVQEGRRIWQEVIAKWRAGEIHIDEELVCAMGRLLQMSSRMSDWDDVLNLIRQTMKIERQIAPLGSPARRADHVPQDSDAREPVLEDEDSEGYKNAPSTKAFQPVLAPSSDRSSSARVASI
jgi:pentatricopeptide repeat protein